ncbi:MAG: AAA family ATPase [Methyloprofundus sp.]|nr:AAA family ATPase [Methyloprofundus sp.]
MITKIKFKNYKLFKQTQTLEIKPITILIGKNSSGKTAVLKLPTLIEDSLTGSFPAPLRLINNTVELGGEYRDLLYGRRIGTMMLSLEDANEKLELAIGVNKDNSSEIFSWTLNGEQINDLSIEKFKGFLNSSKRINSLSLKAHYISSKREGLERYIEKYDRHCHQVGIHGENVYSILIEDGLTTPQRLIKEVSGFYRANFEGWGLKLNQDNSPPYQLELEKGHLKINLKEVGLGMIHALPLVVQALMPSKEESLLLIEEPELHLHPAAHGNLAQLFAESLKDANKHYLIETHSPNFVLRLRRLVAQGDLNKDQLVIYYVDFDEEKNESFLTRINIDELGKPRNEAGDIYWPQNIFSETLDETSAIRAAQLDKETHDS